MVEQSIVGGKYSHTGWVVASCTITFRRCNNLHEVRERLYVKLMFAILGYLVRQPAAHAIYSAVFAIEVNGERGPACTKRCPRCDVTYICMHILLSFWERPIVQ